MEATAGKKSCILRCNRGIFPKYKIVVGENADFKTLFKESRLKCQMVSRPMSGCLPESTITRKKSIIKVKIKVTEKTSSKTDARNLKLCLMLWQRIYLNIIINITWICLINML